MPGAEHTRAPGYSWGWWAALGLGASICRHRLMCLELGQAGLLLNTLIGTSFAHGAAHSHACLPTNQSRCHTIQGALTAPGKRSSETQRRMWLMAGWGPQALTFAKGGRFLAGDEALLSTPITPQPDRVGYVLSVTSPPQRMERAFPLSKPIDCTATTDSFLATNLNLLTSAWTFSGLSSAKTNKIHLFTAQWLLGLCLPIW